MTAIHTLTQRAMVLNLRIGYWQGNRLDKAASAEVVAAKGAKADAARVNKSLIPKEALAPIKAAMNAIRAHFYEKTMPWRDNGDRLITRLLYLDFVPEHEKLVSAFREEVEKFLTHTYPSAREQAGFHLGTLFDPHEYPQPSELRRKFYVDLDIDAITTAGDFRVELDDKYVEQIKNQMEAAATRRVNVAMQDVWRRLAETIGYFHERMADPEAVFRDSTVENVAELIDLIPGLNVLDDPNIEQIRRMVDGKLTGLNAKDIRKDPAHRAELATEAEKVLDVMKGFMSAFGNGEA